MSSYDNDPPEFVGTDHTTLADPKPRKRVAATSQPAPKPALVEELAAPEPPVAGVPSPTPLADAPSPKTEHPGSHPKHAIARPLREHAEAVAEVEAALAEKRDATLALTDAEIAETQALMTWLELQPKMDPEALRRDYINRSVEQRAQNKAAGLPVEGVKTPTHGNSAVDIAAAQRPRQSAQQPSAPLRSPVARRLA